MSNFLVTHAQQNVWCDPEQDYQHIIQPTRITDPRGVMGTCQVLWNTITLPTQTDRYHVYQIGQVNPSALGLVAGYGFWLTLASVMTSRRVYIQVYTKDGILFPLAEAYIMFTKDRTLIVALKEQPTLPPLKTTQVYFRFYSNSYFASRRSDGTVNQVTSGFYRHTNTVDGLAFQNLFHSYLAKPGFTSLTVNGQLVNDFIPMNLTVGDVLEFVYDTSVKKVVDFDISGLQTFESVKDSKIKYLLHYAGPQANGDTVIDYRDDCDVWLFKKGAPVNGVTPYKGIYFHKNQDDAFRQVTHRDYSAAVPYVSAYLDSQTTWGDITQLTLRVVIRNAGWDRPLVDEAHRIKELYKLNETDLVNAFLGIDSTVDVWRAPNLENSDYVRIMDAELNSITLPMVESAYGYNAIGRLLADSPQYVTTNTPAELGPALQAGSTVYEYDANGVLLGWYPHVLGAEYLPVYQGTALVEGAVGNGSTYLPIVMGQQTVTLDPTLSYRFYLAQVDHGQVLTGTWQDVTGDSTKYLIQDGVVHWLVNMSSFQTCVKSDGAFLAYDLNMAPANGLLQFSVQATVSYPNGASHEVLYIPPGQLDLWLNGHALIENLDYYVTWPQVVIVNKAFLVAGNQQKITVRGSGFCNSDFSRSVAEEASFLEWGALSHNDRFNIRDDKVIRIIAAGRTLHRDQVVFSEDRAQALLPVVPNGSPYQVTNVVTPVRSFCDQDTYALQAPALATDKAISDYLTLHLPDVKPSGPDVIADKYSVYSPFCSTVIHDLVNGILLMDNFMGQYSDKDVKDALQGYMYLLAYDPTQKHVDLGHVAIHPHNLTTVIELNYYQYNFIARAVHVILNDEVDLSAFLAIVPF